MKMLQKKAERLIHAQVEVKLENMSTVKATKQIITTM